MRVVRTFLLMMMALGLTQVPRGRACPGRSAGRYNDRQ